MYKLKRKPNTTAYVLDPRTKDPVIAAEVNRFIKVLNTDLGGSTQTPKDILDGNIVPTYAVSSHRPNGGEGRRMIVITGAFMDADVVDITDGDYTNVVTRLRDLRRVIAVAIKCGDTWYFDNDAQLDDEWASDPDSYGADYSICRYLREFLIKRAERRGQTLKYEFLDWAEMDTLTIYGINGLRLGMHGAYSFPDTLLDKDLLGIA